MTYLFRRRRRAPDYCVQRLDIQTQTNAAMSGRLDVESRINDRQDTALTELQSLVAEQAGHIAMLERAISELWSALHAAHSRPPTGCGTATCAVDAVAATSCAPASAFSVDCGFSTAAGVAMCGGRCIARHE